MLLSTLFSHITHLIMRDRNLDNPYISGKGNLCHETELILGYK